MIGDNQIGRYVFIKQSEGSFGGHRFYHLITKF